MKREDSCKKGIDEPVPPGFDVTGYYNFLCGVQFDRLDSKIFWLVSVRWDSSTKIEGQVEPGSQITIRYGEDFPGSLYATEIKGPKQKKN